MMTETEALIGTETTAPQSEAQARAALFARLDEATEEVGHFETVGARHWAYFEDAGPQLIVTFDTVQNLLALNGQMPPCHGIAQANGWSHLCIIADGDTFYRDAGVYAHFDRLVDDAFFEDFDRVLFYGHGPMGGHAACAFAVTAPGAQVLALNARATYDPAETGWDRRNLAARSLDFTSRYGYAPEMLEGAGKVVVIHDSMLREDAMQQALFRAPWVTRLATPLLGERIEWGLRNMGLLPELLERAMAGTLDRASFAKLWRKRRDFAPYLKALLEKAETNRRKGHAIMVCRSVTRRLRAPHFAKRLHKLTGGTEGAV